MLLEEKCENVLDVAIKLHTAHECSLENDLICSNLIHLCDMIRAETERKRFGEACTQMG